jgi:hypothetical protein
MGLTGSNGQSQRFRSGKNFLRSEGMRLQRKIDSAVAAIKTDRVREAGDDPAEMLLYSRYFGRRGR